MKYMELNDETLNEVQDFSYKYLLREEIEIITGIPVERLKDVDDPAGKAFIKGRLLRKAEFNDSVIKLTKQLSSPAMAIESEIALQTFINDQK